jgi:hypothetical protein
MPSIFPVHQHTQIDDATWLAARRFRLIAADGQSRIFAVDAAGDASSSTPETPESKNAADGLYGLWVHELATLALYNLEQALDREAAKLRRAAERDSERIAQSRRIQVRFTPTPPLPIPCTLLRQSVSQPVLATTSIFSLQHLLPSCNHLSVCACKRSGVPGKGGGKRLKEGLTPTPQPFPPAGSPPVRQPRGPGGPGR